MATRKLYVKQYYSKEKKDSTPDPIAEFRAWAEYGATPFDVVKALNKLAEELGSRKKVAQYLGVTPRSERRYRAGTRVPAARVVEELQKRFPNLEDREQIKVNKKAPSMDELEAAVERMEWIFKSIFFAKRNGKVVGSVKGEEIASIDRDEAKNLNEGIQRYARFYNTSGGLKAEYDERAISRFDSARSREYARR